MVENYEVKRDFVIGDKVNAIRCENGEPMDDIGLSTVVVEKFSHSPRDTDDNNRNYFYSDGVEYLFYSKK